MLLLRVDLDEPLLRSLKDEREMLLARLKQYQRAFHLILELADEHDEDEVSAEETLIKVGTIAEATLKL